MNTRLQAALAAIDAANAEDPNTELVDGEPQPKEWIYGRRMSAWLAQLRPDAPEALQIAVRAQHIRRWHSPRSGYPMDKRGYLMWRKALYGFHADSAEAILRGLDYDAEMIARVRFLIEKKQINKDPDTQTLEDCACLVFLQFHFVGYIGRWEDEKIVDILQKTWRKMSPQAHEAALGLDLPEAAVRLVKVALGGG
jgi:hypothetical protein